MKLILNSFIFLVLFNFSSCKKDGGIVQKQVVISKIDLSISTDYDIVDFDVVTDKLYFALAYDGSNLIKVFRTKDGGKNWVKLNGLGFLSKPQSIAFTDEYNGIVVAENGAIRTYNGGANWSSKLELNTPIDFASSFIFAGKTENNEFLLVESGQLQGTNTRRIFTSAPTSVYYSTIFSSTVDENEYNFCHFSDGKIVYFCHDFNCTSTQIAVFDTETYTYKKLDFMNNFFHKDMMVIDDDLFVVSDIIIRKNINDSDDNEYFEYYSNGDYESIEKINDYIVAVGNNKIATNYSGKWQMVTLKSGQNFHGKFLKVKKLDDKYFLISGENGLFVKATFE